MEWIFIKQVLQIKTAAYKHLTAISLWNAANTYPSFCACRHRELCYVQIICLINAKILRFPLSPLEWCMSETDLWVKFVIEKVSRFVSKWSFHLWKLATSNSINCEWDVALKIARQTSQNYSNSSIIFILFLNIFGGWLKINWFQVMEQIWLKQKRAIADTVTAKSSEIREHWFFLHLTKM